MAKFNVMSLFGVNVDFAYFNIYEIIDALGLRKEILRTLRVANLIKKHGKKHHIVSIVMRQVALAELKPTLNGELLPYDSSFQDIKVTRTDYERQYEAQEKLILLCYSLAHGKSVTSVKRLKGDEFSKIAREFRAKGKSLYDYFRSILNDNTRDYVLSYKAGELGYDSVEREAKEVSGEKTKKVVEVKKAIAPTPFGKEITTAVELMSQGVEFITSQVKNVFNGASLDLSGLRAYCQKLSDSYDRNPNALLAVRYVQNTEDYIAQHSVACAILACHLAKALQLESKYVNVIAIGALVFDLGRFKLPTPLTQKSGKFTDAEFQLMRKHLQFGEIILSAGNNIPKVIYQMLWEHHERIDGTGYPHGKIDNEISVYGKIGAIVDAYDSLTSEQAHKAPLTPTDALKKMRSEAGLAFDEKLMALFINSIGAVPVGSCVELSNGRIAFVLTLNNKRQPSLVRQVYSLSSKSFISAVDLALDKNGDVRIVKVVLPSNYNLHFVDHVA